MDMTISNCALEDIDLGLTGKDSGKKRRRILEKAGQEGAAEGNGDEADLLGGETSLEENDDLAGKQADFRKEEE